MAKKPFNEQPEGPFHNPFGGLSKLRDALPAGETKAPPPPKDDTPARAVVRMERKGRGGKEVTVVEQLGLPAPKLAVWLKELKNALGCGGSVEEETLVFQGDQRDRVKALLEARGVKRISMG